MTNTIQNEQQFPDYLAFGKLNKKSICTNGESKTAEYELLGEKVMEVNLLPNRAEIKEFYKGKLIGLSTYHNLNNCICNHFVACPISKNKIMEELMRKVCNLGNIYFEFPKANLKDGVIVYYPAVTLFIIRVPITNQNLHSLSNFIQNAEFERLVHDFYKTTITIKYKKDSESTFEEIHLLELITPLAYVYERVKLLIENKLILTDKLHRAIIQDTTQIQGTTIQSFYGNSDDTWSTYSLLAKG